MSLKSNFSGTFTLEQLARMTWPVAWSGTMPKAEAWDEESELHALVRRAKKRLHSHYDKFGDGETEYAVKVVEGEVIEIVEA